MARRRTETADSLDLLLDTMCNAFGGIVMIAILVAILTREAKLEEYRLGEVDPETESAGDIEAQRIQKDIEEIEKRNAEVEGELEGLSSVEEMSDKHNAVSSALARAEEEVENLTRQIAEKEKKMDSDRSDRMKEMNQEMAAAEKKAAENQKEIADLQEQREKLTRSIEKLEDQIKDLVASQKRELRPPKLRETEFVPVNFIARFGEIFPVEKLVVDDTGVIQRVVERNPDSIKWEDNMAVPEKGKGLKVATDAAKIRELLGGITRVNRKNASTPDKQLYAVGLVYRDSFPAYVEFQKLIREMGIPSGWKPVPNEDNFRFGSGGSKVKAQ